MQGLREAVRVPPAPGRKDGTGLPGLPEPRPREANVRVRSEHTRPDEGQRQGGAETDRAEQGSQGQAGRPGRVREAPLRGPLTALRDTAPARISRRRRYHLVISPW